jgi:hypothetical protein
LKIASKGLRLATKRLDQSTTQVHLALGRQAWLATRRRAAPDTRQEDVEGKKSSKHIVIPPSAYHSPTRLSFAL